MQTGQEYVASTNIKNFERQLKESTDPAQVELLRELLVLEKAKLITIHNKL